MHDLVKTQLQTISNKSQVATNQNLPEEPAQYRLQRVQ